MTNIIGWFKGLAFVLTNAGEFARQQEKVNALVQSVEEQRHTINRLCIMLKHDEVNITVSDKAIEEHFDYVVSKSVMKWLANWLNDYDLSNNDNFKEAVESVIEDFDLSDAVESCVSNSNCIEDALDNIDWSYKLDLGDLDVSSDFIRKLKRDGDVLTKEDIDLDDVMLRSDNPASETKDETDIKPLVEAAVKEVIFAMLTASYEMARNHNQQKGDSNV